MRNFCFGSRYRRMRFFLTLGVWAFFAAACLAQGFDAGNEVEPDAVIIYTGNISGNLTPKACCGKIGGIARRATRIEQLKTVYPNALLIDCGDMVGRDDTMANKLIRVKIAWSAESSRMIGYDALNVADGELLSGALLSRAYASGSPLPMTSANVEIDGKRPIPYIVKNTGRVRIAVVGIVSESYFKEKAGSIFVLNDPVTSVQELLPEIRQNADLIVLVSHAPVEETKKIVHAIPQIDLAIVSHDNYPDFLPVIEGDVKIFKNTVGGATVGLIKIRLNRKGRIKKTAQTLELLDSRVKPEQPWYSLENSYRMDAD